METESREVGPEAQGRGRGIECLMGAKFQFRKMTKFQGWMVVMVV